MHYLQLKCLLGGYGPVIQRIIQENLQDGKKSLLRIKSTQTRPIESKHNMYVDYLRLACHPAHLIGSHDGESFLTTNAEAALDTSRPEPINNVPS